MPSYRLDPEDREHFEAFLPDFIRLTRAIEDPRQNAKVKHSLPTILFVCLSASMAGAKSILAMGFFAQSAWPWVRRTLGDAVDEEPPSHDTIGRLFQKVKPAVFESLLSEYAHRRTADLNHAHQIAIDGKTLTATARRDAMNQPLTRGGEQPATTVSAYSVETGLTMACHTSLAPGSEHACVAAVLAALDLRGALVSVDAGNAYPKFAAAIRSPADGSTPRDYLMCIKGNNAATFEHCARIFDAQVNRAYLETDETVAARRDKRLVRVAHLDPDRCAGPGTGEVDATVQRLWPDGKCVVEVQRYRGTRTNERNDAGQPKQTWHHVYYVSSRALTAAQAMDAIRAHWHVENRLHWILDVHYGEDAPRARSGYLAHNLATLRRVSNNLLAAATGSTARLRYQMKFALDEGWRDLVWGIHA